MSTLLQTRLPVASTDSQTVDSDTYNRLVRVIELNIGSFNPILIATKITSTAVNKANIFVEKTFRFKKLPN